MIEQSIVVTIGI